MSPFRIAKYIVSGLIGISVNLGLYHALVAYFGVPYLAGSVIAIACATIVGFVLQKFWTFEDRGREQMHVQFAWYVLVVLVNIGINTMVVYVLVQFFAIYYLLAQAIGAVLVAAWSFFAYRIIFKKSSVSL